MSPDATELADRIRRVPAERTFAAPDLPPFGADGLAYDSAEPPALEHDGIEVRRAEVGAEDVPVVLKQVPTRRTVGAETRDRVASEAERRSDRIESLIDRREGK